MVRGVARRTLFRVLENLRDARLEIRFPGGARVFGNDGAALRAEVDVRDDRFFSRALWRGHVSFGETYTDGLWTTPDLFAAVRVGVRNAGIFEGGRISSAVSRASQRAIHRRRGNSIEGSRRNIEAHYDVGNDFYRLFLDRRHMAYSCGWFESDSATLEDAQKAKFEKIARKLELSPAMHVLEIGTGWGGFAVWAARRYGCRITTTTISRAQHDFARDRIASEGLSDRVTLLYEDYRRLSGTFDRIVSIEMFEAVGLEHYDDFFGAAERLLSAEGAALVQTITMNERDFPAYRRRADWIQLHVFPGAELACVSEILRSIGRVTRLTLVGLEDIGLHYVRTLLTWRERLRENRERALELGYDERFLRLFDFYFASCAAAFAERHIGDAQLLFVKHPSAVRRGSRPAVREAARAAAAPRFAP
jgi:cyclopropane-fatty-acyl-phospholipid synthase